MWYFGHPKSPAVIVLPTWEQDRQSREPAGSSRTGRVLGPQPKAAALGTWQRCHLVIIRSTLPGREGSFRG